MADHITTIRLKTVGMAEAATEVQALDRAYEASLKGMEAANKSFNVQQDLATQRRLEGREATEKEAKVFAKSEAWKTAEMEKQLRIYERAGIAKSDPLSFEFRENDIVSHGVSLQSKFKDDPKLMVAAERTISAELLDNEKNANAAWIKDAKASSAEYLKTVQEERANAGKFIEGWNKLKIQGEARTAAEITKIAEKNEIERQKIIERGGDAAQKYLDKINGDQAAKAAGVGNGLNGFGGKMILGMAAGRTAGDILGDRHGGQEIGSAISGFMFGGPMIGIAIAAMDLIGQSFKAQRENALAAEKATKEYTASLNELSDQWSNVAINLSKGNIFEESMRGMAKSGRTNAEKAQAILDAQGDKGAGGFVSESMGSDEWRIAGVIVGALSGNGLISNLGGSIGGSFDGGKPASQSEREAATKMEKDAIESRKDALEFEKAEAPKIGASKEQEYQLEVKLDKARTMKAGKLRDEWVLNSEILLSNTKLTNEYRVRSDLADRAIERDKKLVAAAISAKDMSAQEHAEQDLAEAKQAKSDLDRDRRYQVRDKKLADETALKELANMGSGSVGQASDRYQFGYTDFSAFNIRPQTQKPHSETLLEQVVSELKMLRQAIGMS